jgi:hypothetical protein
MSVLKEVYPLRDTHRGLITLDGGSGLFRRDNRSLNVQLPPAERIVMVTALNQPYTIVPASELFAALNPRYKDPNRLYIGDTIRPVVSKLRDMLERIDEDLKHSLITFRNRGYMYLPDSTVRPYYKLDLKALLSFVKPGDQ